MKLSTRKLASVAAALVLVAAGAATTATPALAKKPEGNVKPKTAFTIKVRLMQDDPPAWYGTFSATGAIKDSGEAFSTSPSTWLGLSGNQGSMEISITGGGFTVVSGTGAYADLQATGSVSWGNGGKRVEAMTLKGNVLNSEP